MLKYLDVVGLVLELAETVNGAVILLYRMVTGYITVLPLPYPVSRFLVLTF